MILTPDEVRALRNKVVLISGSSRGIGRECALLCGRAGAQVMIHGRDPVLLQELKKSFRKHNLTVHSVTGDISSPTAAAKIIATCIRIYGKMDILINNAGVSMRGNFSDCTPEVFATLLNTNTLGSMYLSHAALPHVHTRGSIVLVSSAVGLYGFPGVIPYSVAKMALTALYQGLHAELYTRRIRVGIVYLGFVKNDANKKILAPDGNYITVNRSASIDQQKAAVAIIKCAVGRRRVIYLSVKTRVVLLMTRLFPSLLMRIARRSQGRFHAVSAE